MNFNLAAPFDLSALAHPDRLAIVDARQELTYAETAGYARAIAAALGPAGRRGARIAILGTRSVEACIAVLGTAWTGAAYVPLNMKLPEARLIDLLRASQFDALICDAAGEARLTDALIEAAPAIVLLADRQGRLAARAGFKRLGPPAEGGSPARIDAGDLGYIEYTSGTTGAPKGVMITAGGVAAYIHDMQSEYALTPEDRVAETADLSFDISVSNMFLTWNAGAALYILDTAAMFAPVKFVRNRELTVWFSVPSVVPLLQKTKSLTPGAMPTLRLTFFAGEPLPAPAAEAWALAAPNSLVDNLYGPTEATVVCLRQRFENPPCITPERGIVAIGRPYRAARVAILDENLRRLPPGQKGEIALAGPQLSAGYYGRPDLTAVRFPMIDGERWYLTGDYGVEDYNGVHHHLGRIDNQVKVRGNRVELEEIEEHLRRLGRTNNAAAVAWPMECGSASGIVAFVSNSATPRDKMAEDLRQALPSYMTPSQIFELEALPLNDSGKIDRKALIAMLEAKRA